MRILTSCTAASALLIATAVGGAAAQQPPSAAPTVALNTVYYGNTASDDGDGQVDMWRLPGAVLAGDQVQVALQIDDEGGGSVDVCLTGNVDDFDYLDNTCNLSDSDSENVYDQGRVKLIADHRVDSGFLSVADFGFSNSTSYHFAVEAVRHRVGLALRSTGSKIRRKGTISAVATLTNGAAVADGTRFTLNIVTRYSDTKIIGAAKGGLVKFRYNLPAKMSGHHAHMQVKRTTDTRYLRTVSPKRTFLVR